MEENEVYSLLIAILSSALNETDLDLNTKEKISADSLLPLYIFAKKHDLAHILSSTLFHSQVAAEHELWTKLKREEIIAVYRYEQMQHAFEQICEAFEAVGIAYIPLKGAQIRPCYPTQSMRTSCDIDVLIHEDDLELAIRQLEQRGFSCGERHYHEVSLFSGNKIHLELHFNIQENVDQLDLVLKDAWEHVVPENGSRYNFTKEFFVFYTFAHMAYHFLGGGCGLRSLMDVWVIEHKMGISYTCAEKLLRKAGIYQFAVEMRRLAEQCFSEHSGEVCSDAVLRYILVGGVYGSAENNMAVQKTRGDSILVYGIKRLFLPYKSMTILYPVLKKIPILLPIFWVVRWLNMLFTGGTKRALSELTLAKNIPNGQIEEIKRIRTRLGL